MEYREFGKAGFKVSRIGMGTFFDAGGIVRARVFGYHKNEEDKISAINKGIELGINLIHCRDISVRIIHFRSHQRLQEGQSFCCHKSLSMAPEI